MKPVEIYAASYCGYCHRAKRLLDSKGISYTEIDVTTDTVKRQEMMKRANGGRTVPQIFIGDIHVGGSDELHALDRKGKLDAMIAG